MMSPGNANLVNALMLIAMGFWGYQSTQSPTALIPVVAGVLLFVMTNFVRNHHKLVSHIAVLITLLMLVVLVGRLLPKAIETGGPKLYRIGAMSITGAIALVSFIKSFRDARKAREGNT